MSAPFFSVLMLTYNSSWDKTRQTLYSILIQKFADFEIVIADDGSQDNNFSKIEEYFATNHFTNYTLVANETNQGIVKNFDSGLVLCKGKYIKPISPGDFLYDENTLASVYDEIKDGDAAVYFGNAVYYSNTGGNIHIYDDNANPMDLTPYLKKDYKTIKKNYLVGMDRILGASVLYRSDKFKYYFHQMLKIIKYAEDCSIGFMIAHDEKIDYLSTKGVIWYEYSSGISTNGNSKWGRLIDADYRNMLFLLVEKKIIPLWLYELHYSESNLKRWFIKLFHFPIFFIRQRLFSSPLIIGWSRRIYNVIDLKRILKS